LTEEEFLKAIDGCAYKEDSECSDEERHVRLVEFGRCKNSFFHFFKYCKLLEAPVPGKPGGIIPFTMWDHTKQIGITLLTKKLITILKSRQIGASWEVVGMYCLWFALFHQGATILLFSKGEIEAAALLLKAKQVYSFLPPFLKLKINPDSTTEIGFPTMYSTIKAMASTETAGISYNASIIVCDEHIQHPYAEANYNNAKPAIDAGGQFISIFTADENKLDSLAVSLFMDATSGKNDFTPLFFPWTVRPDRDKTWYEHVKRNTPESELKGLSPDIYMARNYPHSVEEALSAPKAITVFTKETLDSMMGQTENSLTGFEGIDSNIIHIYRPHSIGEFYISASDISHGVGQDYSVTVILNVKTGAVVADIYHNHLLPEEFAYHTVKLLGLYQNPLWLPENNDWGRVVITSAQTLGYKNIGKCKDKAEKIEDWGWQTNEKTRMDLWGSLIPAVNNRQIVIYNKDGLKSLYDIIRQASKNGRIEALSGRHDDYAMCLGIAWVNRNRVATTAWEPKTLHSLHFATPNSNKPWVRSNR
jgi:hypothetical protein